MMIVPATTLSSFEFFKNIWPIKVAAAPNIIKTNENPTVKKIIGNKLIFFFF